MFVGEQVDEQQIPANEGSQGTSRKTARRATETFVYVYSHRTEPLMNIQAKVALAKQKHPEYYCFEPRCLWRTMILDPCSRLMVPAKGCGDGWCPRHKRAVVKVKSEAEMTVDAMLRDIAYLLYGCPFEVLDSKRQDACINEASSRFTEAQLHAGDLARKAARENV
jgi:hypothetical protein